MIKKILIPFLMVASLYAYPIGGGPNGQAGTIANYAMYDGRDATYQATYYNHIYFMVADADFTCHGTLSNGSAWSAKCIKSDGLGILNDAADTTYFGDSNLWVYQTFTNATYYGSASSGVGLSADMANYMIGISDVMPAEMIPPPTLNCGEEGGALLYDPDINGIWVDGVCQATDYVCPDTFLPFMGTDGSLTCNFDCNAVPPLDYGSIYGYDSYAYYDATDATAAFAVDDSTCSSLSSLEEVDSVLFTQPSHIVDRCPGWSLCLLSTKLKDNTPVDCSLTEAIKKVEESTNFVHLSSGDASFESCVENAIFGNYITPQYINTADSECPENPYLCFAVVVETCVEKYSDPDKTPYFSNYNYRSQKTKEDCSISFTVPYHYMPSDCEESFVGLCYEAKKVYDEDNNVVEADPEDTYDQPSDKSSPPELSPIQNTPINSKTPSSIRGVQDKSDLSGGSDTSTGTVYDDVNSSQIGMGTDISEMNNRMKGLVDNYNKEDGSKQSSEIGDLAIDSLKSHQGFSDNIVDGLGFFDSNATNPYGELNFDPITFSWKEDTYTLFSVEMITDFLGPYIDIFRSIIIAIAAMSAFFITFRNN